MDQRPVRHVNDLNELTDLGPRVKQRVRLTVGVEIEYNPTEWDFLTLMKGVANDLEHAFERTGPDYRVTLVHLDGQMEHDDE